jgi:hypothetical protein
MKGGGNLGMNTCLLGNVHTMRVYVAIVCVADFTCLGSMRQGWVLNIDSMWHCTVGIGGVTQ